jgi:SAM-dependent methyltransferase
LTGTNHFANLNKLGVSDVLDVGSGSGVWVLEMCHDYPDTMFTGMDIAAAHPTAILPKNARFIQANLLQRLPFSDQSFDYIHIRQMSASIPTERWTDILPEILRILRPNGILEIFDSSGENENAGHWHRTYWRPKGQQLRQLMNMDPTAYRDVRPWLQEAGYTDIEKVDVLQPVGPWGGVVGKAGHDIYRRILTELKKRFVSSGAIPSAEEAEEAFQGRMDEITNGKEAILWSAYIARRPLA